MTSFGHAHPRTDYIIQLSYLPLLRYRSLLRFARSQHEGQAMQPIAGRRNVAPSMMKTRLLQATLALASGGRSSSR
jgi:hypothetical protein